MRGSEIRSDRLLSYVDLEARGPAKHPLRAIRVIVDEALMVLSADFDSIDSPIGRSSIPPEALLRTLLLQAFDMVRSERQLMEQLDFEGEMSFTFALAADNLIRMPKLLAPSHLQGAVP